MSGKPPISIDDGALMVTELLEKFPDTDCIFCVSDLPAFGALSTLKANGRRVPHDIGVAGFGNFEVSRFATPTLSTVIVDPRRIGEATGQLLAELLNESSDSERASRHVSVESVVSLRGSTK